MSCIAYYFPGLFLLIFVTEQSKWYTKSCTVLQGKSVFCLLCILIYFNHCTSLLLSVSCALKFQQFLASLVIFLNIRLLFPGADIVYSLSSYSNGNTICVISWSFCFPYKNNFVLGNHPGSFHLFYVFPLIVDSFSFKKDETSDSSYEVCFPWVRMIKYLKLFFPPKFTSNIRVWVVWRCEVPRFYEFLKSCIARPSWGLRDPRNGWDAETAALQQFQQNLKTADARNVIFS